MTTFKQTNKPMIHKSFLYGGLHKKVIFRHRRSTLTLWHSSLKLCDPLGLLLSFLEIGFNTFFGVIGT